jgi:hypothetical protein
MTPAQPQAITPRRPAVSSGCLLSVSRLHNGKVSASMLTDGGDGSDRLHGRKQATGGACDFWAMSGHRPTVAAVQILSPKTEVFSAVPLPNLSRRPFPRIGEP